MFRLGLCCIFREEPIKFRRTTVKHLLGKPRKAQLSLLAEIALHNAHALEKALLFCSRNGIGAFRINSQILPVKTHGKAGYAVDALPGHKQIIALFRRCGRISRDQNIRTSFHPDQFIVLNSPDPDVVARSLAELRYQAQVAQWVNADVINLHGGGAYGDKETALKRLVAVIEALPDAVRKRLTLENDDRIYTPADLLPVCLSTGVPLVYDVHHHRCLGDGRDEETTTKAALTTWNREPLFHISSPLEPRGQGDCRRHHDYIDIKDVPCTWYDLELTVDVEAKAKELAVARLLREMHDPRQKRACR